MNQTTKNKDPQESLKLLGKSKEKFIKTQKTKKAPYRIYTDNEIDEFLKDDLLPKDFKV